MSTVAESYVLFRSAIEPQLAAARRAEWTTVVGATDRAEKNPAKLPSARRRKRPEEPNKVVLCACGCGERIKLFDADGYRHRFKSGHKVRRRHV